ncbi:MAG: helix-turn-helix domain-containing protein [Candidatus Obscuribacter sp.]|nr:TetR/AcrR family transcriptional regulator [Candidatus Melainabacteria bacterium]MDX1987420.1 helix-turn-helix domain-containing protein [Candidatus Obscuribacter sp.]
MPKIVDREEYRRTLLLKSFEVFAKKGYAALSMRELAKELSVSTGTLYHYFPSKQELFEALVSHYSMLEAEKITPLVAQNLSLAEKVKLIFAFIEEYETAFRHWTAILFDLERAGLKEIIEGSAWRRSNELYSQHLKQILATDDDDIINFVMIYICGLVVHRIERGDEISLVEQEKLLLQFLQARIK